MSHEDLNRSQQPREQVSQPAQAASKPAIVPGKRTRTRSLPPGPAGTGAPVQRKPDPMADPARQAQRELTARWIDTAVRPDLYPPPVQMDGGAAQPEADVHRLAAHGISGSPTALLHLEPIQRSFGDYDVSGITAHIGGPAAQATQAMGAQAYATGNDIAFRAAPDLHTAAHEAAHVIQQRGGVQLAGGVGQAGDAYERHADLVADRVVRGESAAELLGAGPGGGGGSAVQSKPAHDTPMQALQLDVGTAQQPSNTRERQAAVRNLGEISSFGDAFYSRAGAVLDALLPDQGDKGKVQININLPVNANVRVSFRFVCEGERSASGVKARIEVGAGVTATVDLWVAEAFAQAMAFGYLEAQGDTGEEVFRFMSLALYERVASVSADAADYVWGRSFRRRSQRMMDGDNYVESGLGVELSAGLSADGGDQQVGAGVRASSGTRISAAGTQSVSMLSGKLAVTSSPWSGEVALQLSGGEGNESGQLSFSLARDTDITSFASVLEDGSIQTLMLDWAAGVVSSASRLISRTSGAQSQSLARRVGAIAGLVRSNSLGLNIGSAAALRGLAQSLRALNTVNMGQKLSITLGVTPSQVSFQADLERTSQIELGRNARAPVYVSLENSSMIVSIGPATADV